MTMKCRTEVLRGRPDLEEDSTGPKLLYFAKMRCTTLQDLPLIFKKGNLTRFPEAMSKYISSNTV